MDFLRQILRVLLLIVTILGQMKDKLSGIFFPPPPPPPPPIQPITRRVLVITHDPILQTHDNRRLHEHFGWRNPEQLVQDFISDLRETSYGYLNHVIVEHIVVDGYPVKVDGFQYTEETYLQAWASNQFHQPDGVDYQRLLDDFDLIEKVNANQIDEVWLMGHPYGGYYESTMAGPGAFFCNSSPLSNTGSANRRFIIMGFNFERGVGEMLESYGHRAESIMEQVYRGTAEANHLWRRFTRYDKIAPGQAECGNVHFAPNSDRDYDWGNTRPVPSRCHTWLNFPDLSGDPRTVESSEWGSGDIRRHHFWWMRHFPHVAGQTGAVSNNWWLYIADPNQV